MRVNEWVVVTKNSTEHPFNPGDKVKVTAVEGEMYICTNGARSEYLYADEIRPMVYKKQPERIREKHVIIKDNTTGHPFHAGDVLKLVQLNEDNGRVEVTADGYYSYWLFAEDCEIPQI